MKHVLKLGGLGLSAALIGLAPEIAQAEPTQVTNVEVVSTASGLQLVLETAAGDRPQIFLVKRGSDLVADLINTQLSLPQGNSFSQANPARGIASISVSALDTNSTRVVVSGYGVAPEGRAIDDAASGGIVLSYAAGEGAALGSAVAPPGLSGMPIAQAQSPGMRSPSRNSPDVLIPNPDIRVDGVPVNGLGPINPVPPFQQRAVAPPVGDIAISSTDVSGFVLNLRTAERVPRLVLREAPVEDVLALLARAAGLNLAYVAEGQADSGAGTSGQRTISLDVENESVQEVFNNVLRLSGLEANLMGNTVVVGNSLPDEARNVITRTIRLNQTEVLTARDFLLSYGAEAALLSTQIQSQTIREGQPGELSSVSSTTTTSRTRLEQLGLDTKDQPYTGYATLPLRGLLVSIAPRATGIDEVANEISLTGDPRKVEIATQLLSQLETRRRQVAVNVKIVDVSLSNQDNYNSSFSFGVGDTFISMDQGSAVVNFGGANPATNSSVQNSLTTPPIIANPLGNGEVFLDPNQFLGIDGGASDTVIVGVDGSVTRIPGGQGRTYVPSASISGDPTDTGFTQIDPATDTVLARNADGTTSVTLGSAGTVATSVVDFFQYPTRFLSTLQAQIVNGNAKILTDPTLVIQEGQTTSVNLTTEVISGDTVTFSDTNGASRETRSTTKEDVGLQMAITVNRIDDNGFVTIQANPQVSAPSSVIDRGGQITTLIQRRSIESGQIRMRDGQTLILSGIIQDTDRTTVSKVPILGDIPLLGALFRSTQRENQRNEVIVIVTPNILDDSDYNTFGYGYTPSREARDVLEQQGNFRYPGN